MPQLSLEDRVTLARQFKTLNPNLTDAELGDIVNEAQSVDNDPVKSQALLQKILPKAPQAVPTQLPSSYEGAGYTQADLMKQYNPALLERAYEEQQRNYQASLPSRMIGGILAGGSGSGDVMTKNKEDWAAIDVQNKLQSIDKELARRKAAGEGIDAAGKVQTQAKTAGEYTGSQMKTQEEINQARQKTELGQFGVESARRMNDPRSAETQLAKIMLKDQFASAGLPVPKGIENATAQQLLGFMEPKILDAYKKQIGIVSEEAKARTDQAVTQEVTGGIKPAMARATEGSATFNVKPGTEQQFRAQLVDAVNKGNVSKDVLDAFDAKYPQVSAPQLTQAGRDRLKYGTISAGGVTLPPNPVDVGKAQSQVEQTGKFEERTRTYKTQVEPQIDAALEKLTTTMAGKGTDLVSKWLPANEQQELVNLLAQVNNTYPGALPSSISGNIVAAQKAGGFTGSMVSSLTNDQLRRALNMIKANVQRDIDYERNVQSKQPGEVGKAQTVSPAPRTAPTGTVVMTKNGKTYDIPADKVSAAEAQGYKRK